jgi:hypothetical protein
LVPLARVIINFIIDHTVEGQANISQIKGQDGLLFTDTEPQEVIEWFKGFHQPDILQQYSNPASRTVILPASPVMHHHSDPPEPFPHNEEPQLRRLGPTTVMWKGVPTSENPHKLYEQAMVLTVEKAQLLKLIGEKMVEFRVGLRARWDSATGEVEDIPGVKLDMGADGEETEMGGEDDEAISECKSLCTNCSHLHWLAQGHQHVVPSPCASGVRGAATVYVLSSVYRLLQSSI